jgi:A/G-specific adenine glycosylase
LEFERGGTARQFPWREPQRCPYEILVAEVLLKRTTSTAAARVYHDFLHEFPNPAALSAATFEEIAEIFSRVGLQQQRAAAAKKLAVHLVQNEAGEVPNELHRLLQIPGVGEYTARAVLSVGFGSPAAVVDSNVERVIQRLFMNLVPARAPLRLFQHIADRLLPQNRHREFNLGMLDLAALVCRPSSPRCPQCPLRGACDYYGAGGRESPARLASRATKLGARLRSIRRHKRISLARLAHDSKLSKLTIIRIETGKSTPLPRTVKILEHALGEPLARGRSRSPSRGKSRAGSD